MRGHNRPVSTPGAVDPPPRRVKLIVAYEGTQYQGWQIQRIGIGVQDIIEQALAKLFPSRPQLHSSSRTDTGVHALGMAAHVDLPQAEFRMDPRKLVLALNAWLPEDIRILSARPVPLKFHARFDATGKQYCYCIWNHPAMNPLLRRSAWHVPRPLDLAAMRAAAKLLIGTHDFRSFAANSGYAKDSTVRTLTRCEIRRSGNLLTLRLQGDGFLYRMCRGIVGTLAQVGLGKWYPEDVLGMLLRCDRRVAGMSAPAHGLVLQKVFYGPRSKPGKPPAKRLGDSGIEPA